MPTLTRPKFGPKDHGRHVTLEEFDAADWKSGWKYELIGGRIDVSPLAHFPHQQLDDWLYWTLVNYWRTKPKCPIRYISRPARVFVDRESDVTCPESDLAIYFEFFSDDTPFDDRDWAEISPAIVVEIVSPGSERKDFVRNVSLYQRVSSIREYWLLEQVPSAEQPTLTVYRRARSGKWKKPQAFAYGETYTTDLLPGFELVIDPRQI